MKINYEIREKDDYSKWRVGDMVYVKDPYDDDDYDTLSLHKLSKGDKITILELVRTEHDGLCFRIKEIKMDGANLFRVESFTKIINNED